MVSDPKNVSVVAVDVDRTIRIRQGCDDDPSPVTLRLRLDFWNWITMSFSDDQQLDEYINTLNTVYQDYKNDRKKQYDHDCLYGKLSEGENE